MSIFSCSYSEPHRWGRAGRPAWWQSRQPFPARGMDASRRLPSGGVAAAPYRSAPKAGFRRVAKGRDGGRGNPTGRRIATGRLRRERRPARAARPARRTVERHLGSACRIPVPWPPWRWRSRRLLGFGHQRWFSGAGAEPPRPVRGGVGRWDRSGAAEARGNQ